MKSFLLFTVLLGLAAVSTAQITVIDGGHATQSGPAYPAVPVSPPILYPPIVHLGEGQTQPIQATAQSNGVMPAPEVQQQQQNTAPNQQQPFEFGSAQFGEAATEVGLDSNGESLAEIAREMRQKPNGTNARVYTNEDLQSLPAGSAGGAAASVNSNAGDWSPNNGIINPEGQPQNSVAAPARNESTTGTQGPRSPFAPSSNVPANNTGIEQDNSPQSQAREPEIDPFAQRPGTTEMAQSSPPANPADQNNAAQANPSAGPFGNNGANAQKLPKTASRLPLLGVLGLFTVTIGIFVRYQRAKAK